ncbi:MAG: HipA domain-containing protein [Bacteroidetes bacterium]|nr:HipA domain-containing protein [Bacteroidota bacterium]
MSKCLYCYQQLENDQGDYHPSCAKKLFGATQAPEIDFDLKQLEELAKQIIIKSKAVTGVQPKLSLNVEKHKNEPSRLTIVGLHGDYILKPPSSQFKELPENEDITMHLAELIKIKTARHGLIRLKSGELAYITKRFDRNKGVKIAVEDFCQLSENLTEHKYRGSVEKIGKLTYSFTKNQGLEAQRLFELVLFCYLTGNADMHLKNFSLIENSLGEYEFSPAYDLLNTAIVMPEDKEETALTINGKKSKLNRNDFKVLATSLKISDKSLEAIYKRFEVVLPTWILWIEQSFLSEELKEGYISLINQRHKKLFSR